ncbi:MAG: saccharopine dehydrogenase NADP-binding domain-containing protein [Phycisphaeraceae bacterium]|nr:MAG: saccharopine dehydrogenase NADP-binding domain-containing protein [Phycisphaeraceae bacterium]
MPTAIVLGAGMVGSVIAADLARDFEVTVADDRPASLERVARRADVLTERVDLSDPDTIKKTIAPFDIVCGALASHLGFNALRAVIEAGKPYADISFMPENALDLHDLALANNVTAVVDCGVAPGMSNLLAARSASQMSPCRNIEIYVGGLPKARNWPFQYKAGFAPADVIEEYTRPARLVEHGRTVIREALSEPELVDFPGIGTLEAVNTDGLRSIADTMDAPFMKEKTLRYPGHYELMRVFRDTGLFSKDPIDVRGVKVRPLDVLSTLMFPKWTYEDAEPDLTVMRIVADGDIDGAPTRHAWDLLDVLDPTTGFTSMSRTTAFPCAVIARKILDGSIAQTGVLPPEKLGHDATLVDTVLAELRERNIRYRFTQSAPPA